MNGHRDSQRGFISSEPKRILESKQVKFSVTFAFITRCVMFLNFEIVRERERERERERGEREGREGDE